MINSKNVGSATDVATAIELNNFWILDPNVTSNEDVILSLIDHLWGEMVKDSKITIPKQRTYVKDFRNRCNARISFSLRRLRKEFEFLENAVGIASALRRTSWFTSNNVSTSNPDAPRVRQAASVQIRVDCTPRRAKNLDIGWARRWSSDLVTTIVALFC